MWSGDPVSKMTDSTPFTMMVGYDAKTKTITSVRDGAQEYLGVEQGLEPPEKIFTFFRDASTITSIAEDMAGLPIIEDHIDAELKPTKEQTIGIVGDTEVLECYDESNDSTLMLRNKASFSDKILKLLDSGKRYLSLGYIARVREHDRYDFEQYDIQPRHLAVVDSARGGAALTFLDKGKKTMHEAFLDADGNMSMQKIAELAAEIPEAIKQMDIKELQKLAPMFMKIVETAKSQGMDMPAEEEMEDRDMPEKEMEDGDMPDKEMEDQEMPDKEEEKMKYTDSDFRAAVRKQATEQIKTHATVTDKARGFLPETYGFADKSPSQIMRDTLAETNPGEKFEDNELSVAFKMLRANQKYSNFADSGAASNIDKVFNEDF